jgi:hypothetical protein
VVESSALLKRRSPKGYRGFESLPHRSLVIPSEVEESPITFGNRWRLPEPKASPKLWVGRCEGMIEHLIIHAMAKSDSLRLIEHPVDAEIN